MLPLDRFHLVDAPHPTASGECIVPLRKLREGILHLIHPVLQVTHEAFEGLEEGRELVVGSLRVIDFVAVYPECGGDFAHGGEVEVC